VERTDWLDLSAECGVASSSNLTRFTNTISQLTEKLCDIHEVRIAHQQLAEAATEVNQHDQ
jgi:hypothetical protein